jgi:hypothetical protein
MNFFITFSFSPGEDALNDQLMPCFPPNERRLQPGRGFSRFQGEISTLRRELYLSRREAGRKSGFDFFR